MAFQLNINSAGIAICYMLPINSKERDTTQSDNKRECIPLYDVLLRQAKRHVVTQIETQYKNGWKPENSL